MTRARVFVLFMALAAGGLAVKLVSMTGDTSPSKPSSPPPEIETVDVLAAAAEIRPGQFLSAQNIHWQTWPAASAAAAELITKSTRPNAIQELSGARADSPVGGRTGTRNQAGKAGQRFSRCHFAPGNARRGDGNHSGK